MYKLFCVVVGEGRPFPVKIAASDTVGDLQDCIRAKKGYDFAADAMNLYRVKGLDGDLKGNIRFNGMIVDMTGNSLDKFGQETAFMGPLTPIAIWFDAIDVATPLQIHVLVALPQGGLSSGPTCPDVSVQNLFQLNPLPCSVEFVDAMKAPLSFKIPVQTLDISSKWPDIFSLGNAEYQATLSVALQHPHLGDSDAAVTSMVSLWLHLFQSVCGCDILQNETHPSSSHIRPNEFVITKKNVLVGKCKAIPSATKEVKGKMAPLAFTTFPHGLTSIPAWTSCPSRIELHRLTYLSRTKAYRTTSLTTYYVHKDTERVRFIVDVFKIMRWVSGIEEPNGLMHLFPGVRTKTPNGHYATWVEAGLLKEFRSNAAEINMALIQKIYDANLSHVERGVCKDKTVTITSFGQTLENAVNEHHLPRIVILAHVRAALDELHSLGVAHCDVRATNVFVVDHERVILGDLEYCRPLGAAPPHVKCFPVDMPCESAEDLDEYQFAMFVVELDKMGIM